MTAFFNIMSAVLAKAGVGGAYIGQVATRSVIPNSTTTFGATNQANCRTRHIMRATTNAISIAYATWRYNSATVGEVALGASATITAAIEYPVGTFTQVTFSGLASGTVPDNSTLYSDFVPVSIPKGAVFFVRVFWQSSGGFILFQPTSRGNQAGRDSANGEAYQQAASGLSDLTMGGTITSTNSGLVLPPVAIIGSTLDPSVYIFGDSRAEGDRELYTDASTNVGQMARMVGPSFAYINGGCFGDAAVSFKANVNAHRIELAKRCSHVVSQMGINDILANSSSSTIIADLTTCWGLLGASRIIQATLAPKTSSTDAWTTTTNQSIASAPQETQRVAFNTAVRGTLAGTLGFIDVASIAETSLNSGIWRVDTIVASFTASQSTTTLTASAVTGTINVNDTIASPTGGFANTTNIAALGTGTGGAGNYTANPSQTITSRAVFTQAPAGDGTHENPVMNMLYNTSGIFNTALVHYP